MSQLANLPSADDKVDERRIYGVSVGQVVANCDSTKKGLVQIRLPWMPGYEPWVRVAVLMAGMDGGTYFMPQVDEEVLVAFNHGDVREPYIVGSLWNGKDGPPASDAVNKRIIRTPKELEIEFDDKEKTVTIKTGSGQHVKLSLSKIEISIADKPETASIVLENNGNVTLRAKAKLTIKANDISIIGEKSLTLKSSTTTKIRGGTTCWIRGAKVAINDPSDIDEPDDEEVKT